MAWGGELTFAAMGRKRRLGAGKLLCRLGKIQQSLDEERLKYTFPILLV